MSGLLSVVATPIGNLDDLSPRAARTLAAADVIACEDTRVTRALLNARVPDARAKLIALHARNEEQRAPEIVRMVAAGSHVVLATDAGMPALSDPGQRLVSACAEAALRIEMIPGPSAILAALVASGLPTARFVFEGFLPRTRAARRRRLEALKPEGRTLVIFESPHRLAESLADIAAVLGPRRAAVARELTKLHEEVVRDTLDGLAARAEAVPFRGEITLVIEGAPDEVREAPTPAELAGAVGARALAGETKKDAIAAVAAERRVPKRTVYQAVLDAEGPDEETEE